MLVHHHFVQVDVGHFRGHRVEAVPHQRVLKEFQKQFVVRTDWLNRGIIRNACFISFQHANHGIRSLPFFREVARSFRLHRTIPDEMNELLQRRLANQIKVFVRVILLRCRIGGLRFIGSRFTLGCEWLIDSVNTVCRYLLVHRESHLLCISPPHFHHCVSPPRPELNLYRACKTPADEVDHPSLAAKNLRVPGHPRFQQQGIVINLGCHQNRFWSRVAAGSGSGCG